MTKKNEKSKSAGGKNMSKILSEKQKEVFMQARKNGMHQDLADIIKKSKEDEDD